jgi:hypothetical protein
MTILLLNGSGRCRIVEMFKNPRETRWICR